MKKFDKKVLVFYIFISIIAVSTALFFIKSDSTVSNKTELKPDNENQELFLPKTSKVWTNFTFIHIKDDNWTNAVNWGWCSGSGKANDPYTLKNIIIDKTPYISCRIKIEGSKKYFKIENCTVSYTTLAGIHILNSKNGTIINNTCSISSSTGILINGDGIIQNHTLIDNIIKDTLYGIRISDCKNCSLYENKLKLDGGTSPESGIWIVNSHNITVNNNEILNCHLINSFGIRVDSGNYNRIINNLVKNNNGTGIRVNSGNYNRIINNLVQDNNFTGIICCSSSTYNLFTDNQIINNSIGIAFSVSSGTPSNNEVYKNYFIKNKNHAVDNGTNNKWNTTNIGNYWDNYTGKDANDDGIGDTPQKIPGTAGKNDYFPIWFDWIDLISGDDDDDDDDDKADRFIPGYNLQTMIIAISLSAISIVLILSKKCLNFKK